MRDSSNRLRVLFADANSGNTASRAQGVKILGGNVEWVEPEWLLENPTTFKRIEFRLRNGPHIWQWNQRIKKVAAQFLPHILWIESPLFLYPRTVDHLQRQLQIKCVCAYSDDPRDGNKESWAFDGCLRKYDWIFTTKDELNLWLFSKGARKVGKFWKGFDANRIRKVKLSESERRKYSSDVVFIGHTDMRDGHSARVKYLEELVRTECVRVRIFGRTWSSRKVPATLRNVIVPKQLDGEDYSKAICGAKIALQFPSRQARDTHSSRSIEIPACGTLLLAERTVDHQLLFEEDREAVFFSSAEELCDKADFYIKNGAARRKIADAGRRRVESSGYSNPEIMAKMLKQILKAP